MVHSILLRSTFGVSWESSLNRGHTNCLFCLQGSYRFLDVKLTTFPRLFFPKQWFLFPDSRFSNRWSIETLKKKRKEQSFFHELSWCAAKINNFPELISILQTLSRFRKLLGKDFFTNSRLCTNQVSMKTRKGRRGGIETCAIDASSCKACEINLRHVGKLEYSCCCITVSCANVGECVIRTRHLNLRIFAFTQLNITRTQAQVTCCWIDSCGSIKVRLTQKISTDRKGRVKLA